MLRRGRNQSCSGRQRGEGINREGVLGENCRAARCQENAGDQVEHVVGSVTKHNLVRGDAATLGDLGDQVELVRVALDAIDRRLDGLSGLRAHAQRVLVGGQLDDFFDRDTHFAGQFGDRLARLVGRNGADVGQGLFDKAHGAFLNKRQPGRTREFSDRQRSSPVFPALP